MSLRSLLQKSKVSVLGLNSGTSADGIDLALVSITRNKEKGANIAVKQMMTGFARYSLEIRDLILRLADSHRIDLDTLALADEALGEFIGRKARSFVARCKRQGLEVDCISSHGQTVRHHPQLTPIAGMNVRASLQIASPERISARTGLITISHFRQANTSVGGEGAPITTGAVSAVTHHPQESRLILNLGGIANYFYTPSVDSARFLRAKDLGPANVLLDQAADLLFGIPFDKGGEIAGRGKVSARLQERILESLSFRTVSDNTISTGREKFGPKIVAKILSDGEKLRLSPADILATISQATARNISSGLQPLVKTDPPLKELYITGGGRRNKDFIRRLREELDDLTVSSISKLGFSPDHFEALCFAVLGYYCLAGESAGGSIATPNTKMQPVLGRICQPPVT